MKYVLLLVLSIPCIVWSQFGDRNSSPASWFRDTRYTPIKSIEVIANPSEIERLENIEHASYICATAIPTQIKSSEFTLAEILPNGDKVYRIVLKSPDALGLMVMFSEFKLESGAKLWLYNKDRTSFAGMYSENDNYQSNGDFLSSHVLGSEIIIEYQEPAYLKTKDFHISKIYHYFRGLKGSNGNGFGAAGSCMLNSGCPEGSAKPAALDATCRIRVTGPNFSGFCTGTLVNNTSEDKTPYILTANHCSAKSTLSDLINWEFDFLYHSTTCSNPSVEPVPITFKGCTAPASSGTDYGDLSSDFLLLKLNSTLSTSTHDFTFLGWDRSDGNHTGNFCYHHPKGDIKKISTSNGSTSLNSYGGGIIRTHYSLTWSSTANGRSVTDEGSSGSALINSNGLLIGTLTGGSALCSNLDGTDFYGRFYMHWDKFGTADNQRLKPWLDPSNTGSTTLRSVKLSGVWASSIWNKNENEKLIVKTTANNLNISWLDSGYEITLYNTLGQKILNSSTRYKEAIIDLSSIYPDIYILEARSGTNKEVLKFSW